MNCVIHVVDKSQEGVIQLELLSSACGCRRVGRDLDVIVDGSVRQRVPQERVQERGAEQTVAFFVTEMVAVLVPQMRREIVEVIQLVLVERIKGGIADQMVDIVVLPVMEEIVAVVQEVVKLVPHVRVQQRTVEHATVPQFLEETVEVVAPTERVQQRTVEHVEVP